MCFSEHVKKKTGANWDRDQSRCITVRGVESKKTTVTRHSRGMGLASLQRTKRTSELPRPFLAIPKKDLLCTTEVT